MYILSPKFTALVLGHTPIIQTNSSECFNIKLVYQNQSEFQFAYMCTCLRFQNMFFTWEFQSL